MERARDYARASDDKSGATIMPYAVTPAIRVYAKFVRGAAPAKIFCTRCAMRCRAAQCVYATDITASVAITRAAITPLHVLLIATAFRFRDMLADYCRCHAMRAAYALRVSPRLRCLRFATPYFACYGIFAALPLTTMPPLLE